MSLPKLTELQNTSLGNYGGVCSGAATITPATGFVFQAIQVLADCTITAVGNVSGITAKSLLAGTVVLGRYTSVTIGAGGLVICYYGV